MTARPKGPPSERRILIGTDWDGRLGEWLDLVVEPDSEKVEWLWTYSFPTDALRDESNIYLQRLDDFVETVLIPEYTRGRVRKPSTDYVRVQAACARARKRGDWATARELRKRLRGMPSRDPRDPGFRRLRYCRYADDTLLGFTGPRAEAEEIKQRLAAFLRDNLKLELSEEKTLITHARTGAAKFLGYEITVLHNDRKVAAGRRTANGTISLRVPAPMITDRSACGVQIRGHACDLVLRPLS